MKHPAPSAGGLAARGFTMIELMVTLTVLAILLALAMPAFRDLILNNRLSTASSELQTALAQARSEAVTRRKFITVCPSANDTGTACGSWDDPHGVIVFVDNNGGGAFTPANILKYIQFSAGSLHLATDPTLNFGGAQLVRFTATGMPQKEGILTLCDMRTGNFGRQLQVWPVGRVEATKGISCP